MRLASSLLTLLLSVVTPIAAWPNTGEAFYNIKVGDTVPNPELRSIDGTRVRLLGDDAEASVFLFFKPDQENSQRVLNSLAECMADFPNGRVHKVGIVSDAYERKEVEAALKEANLNLTVLVDEGNTLYGELGTVLTPVAGLTNKQHELRAYLPFRKIGFCDGLHAQIQYVLGEITQEQLDRVLNPPAAVNHTDIAVAKRNLKLATILYEAKDLEKAFPLAEKAVAKGPELAATNGLVAAILAAQQKCAEAQPYLNKALSLDASEPRALEAKAACAEP